MLYLYAIDYASYTTVYDDDAEPKLWHVSINRNKRNVGNQITTILLLLMLQQPATTFRSPPCGIRVLHDPKAANSIQ